MGEDSPTPPAEEDQQPAAEPSPEVEAPKPQAEDAVRQLAGDSNLDILVDVPMKASVELGISKLYIKEILDLVPGSIIELNRNVGDPVDLLINGKLIAKGEVVVVDDNFGFRITDFVRKDELKKDFEI